jgi:Phage gp6-like head-tail connector protein
MAANDLTVIANVKALLQITTDTDDGLLSTLITAASAFLETVCDRAFIEADYTEVRNGKGTRSMSFANYPVTAVSSVLLGSLNIVPAVPIGQPGWPGTGYVFTPTLLSLYGFRFWPGVANVQLQYTAGYAADALPADLVQACNELVALKYKQKDHFGMSGAAGVDGQHIFYDDYAMSPAIAYLVEQYKKRIPL